MDSLYLDMVEVVFPFKEVEKTSCGQEPIMTDELLPNGNEQGNELARS